MIGVPKLDTYYVDGAFQIQPLSIHAFEYSITLDSRSRSSIINSPFEYFSVTYYIDFLSTRALSIILNARF